MKYLFRRCLGLASSIFCIVAPLAASAQGDHPRCDLAGTYVCEGRCQRPGEIDKIVVKKGALTFVNEMGQVSRGAWQGDRTVVAKRWGNLHGRLSEDCKLITWRNGTAWRHQ